MFAEGGEPTDVVELDKAPAEVTFFVWPISSLGVLGMANEGVEGVSEEALDPEVNEWVLAPDKRGELGAFAD